MESARCKELLLKLLSWHSLKSYVRAYFVNSLLGFHLKFCLPALFANSEFFTSVVTFSFKTNVSLSVAPYPAYNLRLFKEVFL